MKNSEWKVTIEWTRPMLERFKVAYEQARAESVETFVFEGNEYLVGYGKYLIEYLETQL